MVRAMLLWRWCGALPFIIVLLSLPACSAKESASGATHDAGTISDSQGGTSVLDAFIKNAVKLDCRRAANCKYQFASQESCLAVWQEFGGSIFDDEREIGQIAAMGSANWDAAQADALIAAKQASSKCAAVDIGGNNLLDQLVMYGILVPATADGLPCQADFQCTSGVCAQGTCASGLLGASCPCGSSLVCDKASSRCRVPVVGDTCPGWDNYYKNTFTACGDTGLNCGAETKCELPAMAGESCKDDYRRCAKGLYCDDASETCKKPGAGGDACKSNDCGEGLMCLCAGGFVCLSGALGTCSAVQTGLGAPCPPGCGPDLDCMGGKCVSPDSVAPGTECMLPSSGCSTLQVCVDTDDRYHTNGTCMVRQPIGGVCQSGKQCAAEEAACDGEICTARPAEGESCTSDSGCAFPFVCEGQVCAEAGASGQPCVYFRDETKKDSNGSCKAGLVCTDGVCESNG